MKLVSYQFSDQQTHLGAVIEDKIVNLNQLSAGQLPDSMLEFLQAGEAGLQTAKELLDKAQGGIALDSVKLLAPIPNPSKVIAIGLNYMDHIREANIGVPELATMFCKYPSSIIGNDAEIRWSNELTQQVDYEAELAVVIGKTARNVSEADAYDYIAGYMNCNDASSRELPFRPGELWLRCKCPHTFWLPAPYVGSPL